MKFFSSLMLAAFLLTSGCAPVENKTMQTELNTLTPEEQKEGWVLLFDGTSTKGWHSYGKEEAGTAWKIKDNALYLDPAIKHDGKIVGGGDLLTGDEFGDFHLKLEWKISEGGNSGIIFYVKEDPALFPRTYNSGPEMQVLDNERHKDAQIHKHRAGDLYDLIASSKEVVKKAGDWNVVEIISKKGKLDFFLNGENIVATTLWGDEWKGLIAGSKFKDMPQFGTFKTGRIALQDHGDAVWYRNIKLKRL